MELLQEQPARRHYQIRSKMERLTIEQKKAMPYPVKSCMDRVAIKDIDTSKRIVTGIYNTALFFDSQYDVVMPGAMNKSIIEHGPNSAKGVVKIKHALFHDLTLLPGRINVLEEKEIFFPQVGKSLPATYFETYMAETTSGNDTLINYDSGVYDNHSIGFKYLGLRLCEEGDDMWGKILAMLCNPEDAQKVGYMFLCDELKLYEGSTVGFGANELTPYLGTKIDDPGLFTLKLFDRLELLTKQVRSGRQSDETLSLFDLQIAQIKQMIFELKREPDIKDTLLKRPSEISTTELQKYLLDNLVF
jgi:hypothetical protein